MRLQIHLCLESDATFGRGEGVAGLVDEEVEYEASTGLPFLRGRTLKGLLVEECANILFALGKQNSSVGARFEIAAQFLFGQPGSMLDDDAHMHVGAAKLPKQLCAAVEAGVKRGDLMPIDVLESLTAIRRQTAVDDATGAPDDGSLRSMRVVMRDTPFAAQLDFDLAPSQDALALLTACVLSLRRAGTGRNRGRGRLTARLRNEQGVDISNNSFKQFQQVVEGKVL